MPEIAAPKTILLNGRIDLLMRFRKMRPNLFNFLLSMDIILRET